MIKIDISNAFNTTCRALTLDVLSGRASRHYACGLKEGQATPTCGTLSNLFGYFKAMRTCHAKLRYLYWDGQVHLGEGQNRRTAGGPLRDVTISFNYSPFMGTCSRKVSGGPGGCFADDGCIKGKLSVALQVLAELKRVLKEDAGLKLNVSKTSILPKGTTQQAVFDVAHSFIAASPALTQLSGDVSLASLSTGALKRALTEP
jgi:hypothetical protein